MNTGRNEYTQGGGEWQMLSFAETMDRMAFRTSRFPNERGAWLEFCDISREFKFMSGGDVRWASLVHCMDSRVHVAHWMEKSGVLGTHYHAIGQGAIVSAANAIASKLALPVAYAGGTVANDAVWFGNELRANDLANGFFRGCEITECAHVGQIPSVGYRPEGDAPFFGGSITGIVLPDTRHFMQESLLRDPEPRIIGIPSSGVDGCGVPFLIRTALGLADSFLTRVPRGKTFGEEILAPSRSFVRFIERLIPEQIALHGIVPAGDSGVASLLHFEKQPFTYCIDDWPPDVPPVFRFLQDDLHIPIGDILTNVNWGIGCYIIAPKASVGTILAIGRKLRFPLYELGYVSPGERKVVFGPEDDLIIYPK